MAGWNGSVNVDQTRRPFSCAHTNGSLAPFFKLQSAQDMTKFRDECSPPADSGITWSKWDLRSEILAAHHAHRNFCAANRSRTMVRVTEPVALILAARRFWLRIRIWSRLSFLHAAACARLISPRVAYAAREYSADFSGWSFHHCFRWAAISGLRALSRASSRTQVMQPPSVYLSAVCPLTQGRPVKYRFAPAAIAAALVVNTWVILPLCKIADNSKLSNPKQPGEWGVV
jgi:hypothetical protein